MNLTGHSSSTARIITLCWSIWRSRNDLLWNNKYWSPIRIVAKAKEYLSQWSVAQGRCVSTPLHPPVEGDGALYWVKPHYNEVKITADAAVFEDSGMSGIGLVARNHEGHL